MFANHCPNESHRLVKEQIFVTRIVSYKDIIIHEGGVYDADIASGTRTNREKR
jgi:hypothetical protein